MRIFGISPVIALTSLAWLGVAGLPEASAQFLGRKPKKRASEMIYRQAAPKVDRSVETIIGPENARITVSLSRQRVYVFAGDQLYIDSPISSGKRAGMTPTGSFKITQKNRDHRSNIYGDFVDKQGRVVRSGISLKVDSAPSGTRYVGAPMRYFMRLTDTGIGLHVGILPGYPASHGCIRLPAEIAPLIFEKVKLGTPVTIEG
jgi:lipoprotein-anchoring transpeptidase ErfK/SrfK